MTPEFYLVLHADNLADELADRVFEAGFDDSSLVMRGGHAAVWIRHREGDLIDVVRDALEQARDANLSVRHVEVDPTAFELENDPRFLKRIERSRAEAAAGKTVRLEDLPD
jgi:hypothetical protein